MFTPPGFKIKYKSGEPCKEHRGCLNHITHPCEGCGRIAGKGIIYQPVKYELIK